jgi:hypothetical protein
MICLSCYYVYMLLQDCLKPERASTCVAFTSLRISLASTMTSVGMLAYKAGLIEALRLRFQERKQLRVERALLLAELQLAEERSNSAAPIAPPHPAGDSGPPNAGDADVGPRAANAEPSGSKPAPTPAALAEHGPEFIVARSAASGNSGSASGSAGALRGECPACKRNVFTTDEGRVKEGNAYYHAGCVKGVCYKCSKNVYADQARSREGDAYYHLECRAGN